MKPLSLLTVFALSLSPALAQFGGDEHNLIQNGKFETANADSRPDFWTLSHPSYLSEQEINVEMMTEGDTSFLRVIKQAATAAEIGSQEIQIPEGTGSLRVAIKMRGKNITRGADFWQLPGLAVTYLFEGSEGGKPGAMDKWPLLPVGDTPTWQEFEAIIPVREGAQRASVGLNSHGWTGQADFTDVVVEVVE